MLYFPSNAHHLQDLCILLVNPILIMCRSHRCTVYYDTVLEITFTLTASRDLK